MGTRGTLRVYLNDDLKIRQYNQWDSYPTGQFAAICGFFKSEDNREALVKSLANGRLCTEEEYEAMEYLDEHGSFPEGWKYKGLVCMLYTLRNRDYGADMLYQAMCLQTTSTERQPMGERVFPDWAMTFDEGGDLAGEEGNYVIELTADGIDTKDPWRSDPENIRFRLSGEYHGIEREYDWNVIPAEEDIEAWEEEEE